MLKKAHKEFQSTQTDGFKAGQRIPDKLLITFLGGKMGSRAAAVEHLVNATMPQAVKQSGFEAAAISDSLALEGLTDEMVAAFSVEKPFSYSCGFDTIPKGQWKQPYRSLKVEVQSAGDEQSCWAAVAHDLREKQKEGATLRIATRGLQMGDVCVADVTVKRNDVSENNIVSRQQGVQLDTDTAETSFVPGAVAQMMGMKVGEQREVVVTLPQQWEPPQFAGVEVTLTITIKELFDRELPELTDAWATKTFSTCTSLGDLRDKLHRGHLQQAAEKTVNALQLAVTYAIADAFDVQPPESMVRELAEQEYQAQLLQLQSQGTMDRKNIEKLATEDLLLKFLENKREQLTRTVKAVMAAQALLAEEGIKISSEEIEAEVKRASLQFNEWGQEFDPVMLREQVLESLQGEKVVDFIQENAEVVFLPPVQ